MISKNECKTEHRCSCRVRRLGAPCLQLRLLAAGLNTEVSGARGAAARHVSLSPSPHLCRAADGQGGAGD